jgi:hypothetical protein
MSLNGKDYYMSTITIDQTEVDKIVLAEIRKQVAEKMNYNRALLEMVESSMEKQREPIMKVLDETLSSVVSNPHFKTTIQEEFEHKVAKSLVAKLEGTVEKAVEVYRQNPALRSKMIIAIENIVKENS